MDFLARRLDGLLEAARGPAGGVPGRRPEDLAFVANATSGVNAVLRGARAARPATSS